MKFVSQNNAFETRSLHTERRAELCCCFASDRSLPTLE